MGLSFFYEFHASADETPAALEHFLKSVQHYAESVGFKPTVVLNVLFDTKERREFSRRIGRSFIVQDERLKGIALPDSNQVWRHNPITGDCRLIPERGVFLVLTDERSCEVSFGFFKFPEHVLDINGKILAETNLAGWVFRDFINSPDPRYREIVRMFADAGYGVGVKDEYV